MSNNTSSLEPTSTVTTSEIPNVTSSILLSTTATPLATTSLPSEVETPELRFIFVPLTVIVIVFLMAAMIFSIIRKKRVDKLRHHLMPLYNFAPGEDEGDWEAELLEDSSEKRGYKSMDYPHNETTELVGSSR